MESEAAVQLNLGQFESSSENIDHEFASIRSRFRDLNFPRVDSLWKVIIALAVFVFVLFASIAMLVHIVHLHKGTSSIASSSPLTDQHNHLEPSAWKETFSSNKLAITDSNYEVHQVDSQEKAYSSSTNPHINFASPPPQAPVLPDHPAITPVVSTTFSTTTSTPFPSPSLPITVKQANDTNLVVAAENSMAWESPCGDWTPFKDERCFKLLPDKLNTFDEAQEICQQAGANLMTVRYPEEQTFLSEWIYKEQKQYDSVWLGAKRDFNTGKFAWLIGNEQLHYENWVSNSSVDDGLTHESAPIKWTAIQDEKCCLHMTAYEGKWDVVPCVKRNLVVCEKLQAWSFQHFQRLFLHTRKEFAEQLKRSLMPVGVGFTYAQLSSQPEPAKIWPHMSWEEVTPNTNYNPYTNQQHIRFWERIA